MYPIICRDVADEDAVDELVSTVSTMIHSLKLPPLWAVVNNAGIGGGGSPVELESTENLQKVLQVNALGPFFVMRAFLPLIRETRGRFVTISSLKAGVHTPGSAPYCSSKAAVNALTTVVAREVAHLGVRAIIIEPGYIESDILFKVPRSLVEANLERATSSIGKLYPGFSRYVRSLTATAKPQRGVSPQVTSEAILSAISTRYPSPLIQVGGLEVWSVWVSKMIPDDLVDFVAQIMFSYHVDDPNHPQHHDSDDEKASLFQRLKKKLGA